MIKHWSYVIVFAIIAGLLSACGLNAASQNGKTTAQDDAVYSVRIGLLKNVTHAPAFIAVKNGYFEKYFGSRVKTEVLGFDNGSDLATAMATGQIDIGYVGPGPLINQFVRSKNIRIISGANNGGAVLVARKGAGIASVKGLAGKVAAIPTRGSTNEISLRLLLQQAGLKVTTDASGVQLVVMAPADTLVAMKQKQIDASLLPEPWGTQIVEEGIGEVVADWNQIPPNNGNYPLTVIAANDTFLQKHRDLAEAVIRANLDAIGYIRSNPEEAYRLTGDELKALSGKALPANLIKAALNHLILTTDVDRSALDTMAKTAADAGYIKGLDKNSPDLGGLLDFSLLQEVNGNKQ